MSHGNPSAVATISTRAGCAVDTNEIASFGQAPPCKPRQRRRRNAAQAISRGDFATIDGRTGQGGAREREGPPRARVAPRGGQGSSEAASVGGGDYGDDEHLRYASSSPPGELCAA